MKFPEGLGPAPAQHRLTHWGVGPGIFLRLRELFWAAPALSRTCRVLSLGLGLAPQGQFDLGQAPPRAVQGHHKAVPSGSSIETRFQTRSVLSLHGVHTDTHPPKMGSELHKEAQPCHLTSHFSRFPACHCSKSSFHGFGSASDSPHARCPLTCRRLGSQFHISRGACRLLELEQNM